MWELFQLKLKDVNFLSFDMFWVAVDWVFQSFHGTEKVLPSPLLLVVPPSIGRTICHHVMGTFRKILSVAYTLFLLLCNGCRVFGRSLKGVVPSCVGPYLLTRVCERWGWSAFLFISFWVSLVAPNLGEYSQSLCRWTL